MTAMFTLLLLIGALLVVMVVMSVVGLGVNATVDAAGKGLGRALSRPQADGFIALSRPATSVLDDLSAKGYRDPIGGRITTPSGSQAILEAGWSKESNRRGFECRWDVDQVDGDILNELIAIVKLVDSNAAITT